MRACVAYLYLTACYRIYWLLFSCTCSAPAAYVCINHVTFSLSWTHTPVVEKLADPGRSAGRIHSKLSTEAGRSEPPLGFPARSPRVELDSQPQVASPWGPAGSENILQKTHRIRTMCLFSARKNLSTTVVSRELLFILLTPINPAHAHLHGPLVMSAIFVGGK